MIYTLYTVALRLRRLPEPRVTRAVCARKAGAAIGEKGYHIFGNLVDGIYTVDDIDPERNVAVHTLPGNDDYMR